MKKSVMIMIVIALILIIGSFLLFKGNLENEYKCELGSDCDFYYTAYSEQNPCPSCFYEDENWICLNKEKAEAKMDEVIKKFGLDEIACGSCSETDYDLYSCDCIDDQCTKIKKEV